MYVVGQYPRFLKAHWKFLKTVVNKLFEFMHESHPGVQDMACDTFLKISLKCKRKFVTMQTDEPVPFICELVDSLPTIISDLEPHQVQAFYEAVGCMLSDRGPEVTIDRALLLARLMDMPNRTWRIIMDQANKNVGSLVEPTTIKEIIKILKCNNRVCHSVGSLFVKQLETFFLDMLNVYKVYSERISAAVAQQGAIATQMSLVRTMRSAKKEVLRLLIVFIDKSGPPESDPQAVTQGFIPPVLDPILGDYQRNIAGARDPEVLALFCTVIEKLKSHVVNDVPRIMEAVFECTLQMITTNFEDYPEHRIRFFEFLRAVNSHCFPALFNIPPEHQKLVVDSVVWAMKHTERNISDTVSTTRTTIQF
jgi:exportin-1